ncbi:anti-sigma factor [Catellatospora sp. NPDC049133]|jgi:anti-sigma-K factor RskA|uniref:anti-sigma factor n=1 Tax=Catellatospora sp. NPDC049133 TaxID=3155499 RepID=UPI00340509F6
MSEIHSLAGPYVLHALDEAERETFIQHLRGCETCAAEVAELNETVARLADDAWSVPPPAMRDNVLAAVRRTRQIPPARPVRTRREPARWWRHPAALTAAACLLVAALVGGTTFAVQEQRLREERAVAQAARQELARTQAVLTAPDATVRTSNVAGGGKVTVVASAAQDAAVILLATHSPGEQKAYQFWLMEGTTPHSAGVLAAGQGTATHLVSGVNAADAMGLTVEPAGGSTSPTLPIIAEIPMK